MLESTAPFDALTQLIHEQTTKGVWDAFAALGITPEDAIAAESCVAMVASTVEQSLRNVLQRVLPHILPSIQRNAQNRLQHNAALSGMTNQEMNAFVTDNNWLNSDVNSGYLYESGGISSASSLSVPLNAYFSDDSPFSSGKLSPLVNRNSWIDPELVQLGQQDEPNSFRSDPIYLPSSRMPHSSPMPVLPAPNTGSFEGPGQANRFLVLPHAVRLSILELISANSIIKADDFDDKPVLMSAPGYLHAAITSFFEMLKANHLRTAGIQERARQFLPASLYEDMQVAVNCNRWLQWKDIDHGIIHFIRKLPYEVAVEKLKLLRTHSFKNAWNIKGCIMSLLSSSSRTKAIGAKPMGKLVPTSGTRPEVAEAV
eukprot:gene11819-33940_t